ncbi:MAG: T9SS type A sorting domain-containing protein [candidate division WOR-3 bacterium]
MRNLMLLGLTLCVGLALATEQWLAPNAARQYVIPDPQPGIFEKSPQLWMPAVDTMKYDDNMPASAWAWNSKGSGWGMKFISPSSNVTLAGALVHFYSGWPVPGGTRALVKVFADDGINGTPGTEIWQSDTLTITRGQWNWVPINQSIVGSNFYVFYVQVDTYPNCPGLSIDAQNNAPSGRKWSYSGTSFSPDGTRGDWLIRAVIDWTPQSKNAASLYFASNMPRDTVPGINFQIRATIKNMGTDQLPTGTPVRLKITGPQSYVYEDTMATTANLQRGQTQQLNFSPAWAIPNLSGAYRVTVWTEAVGEEWPADDTMFYDLSVARWIEYSNWNNLRYLTWAGPERATKFNPADFSIQYPVGMSRVRAQFYLHPSYPWPDSSFKFKIYAGDGSTLLYESPELEAPAGTPGTPKAYDLDSMLIFPSGEFYVSVAPTHSSGFPSICGDDTANNRSWYGSPGSWQAWTTGELFISASVQGGVGVEEGYDPNLRSPSLTLSQYPNPAPEQAVIRWQVPVAQRVDLNLYDATGRLVRNLYSTDHGRSGRVTLDTRTLSAGFYFIRVETASGSATHKLVIQ